MTHQETIQLETTGHRDMHDLTDEVSGIVGRSGVRVGTVHIFNVGSTGTLGTLECDVKPRSRQIVVTVRGE